MNLGTDIAMTLSPTGVVDIDPYFRLESGIANVLGAIVRRLITPRGGLFYDEDYGTDIRAWLNASWTPAKRAQVAVLIEGECEKDERILSASAAVSFDDATRTLDIPIVLETVSGPLQFVLQFGALSLKVLRNT